MRSFGLVETFAIRSFIAVALMASGLAWAVMLSVERVAVEQAAETGRLTAEMVIAHHLEDRDLTDPLSSDSVDMIDEYIVQDLLETDIIAVKLWNTDRELVYSSNAEDEIGTSYNDSSNVSSALEGVVVANIDRESHPESTNQYAEYGDLIEVYAPLLGADGETLGVFEIYVPYAIISPRVRDANLLILGIIVAGSLIVYFTQIRMMQNAARKLKDTEALVSTVNDRLQGSLRSIEEGSLGTLQALISAVDAKDSYTARHSLGVTDYAVAIGRRMGLPHEEIIDLERASLLHDIGKIGVPESVLLKPTKLTTEDRRTIEEHSEMGAHIIESIPFLAGLVPIVRHHHERWDGSGYPAGLRGKEAPLMARILSVADAFDAMTSNRPYRSALNVSTARAELLRFRGIQFDPAVVDALSEALDLGEVSASRQYDFMSRAVTTGSA
ncbi:MAG: HD-GYP domain-containing protein [Actinomycetota bacterium]|nr:HD-GYP domain-containing protein [Actinomycetota bacterium]